MATANLWMGIHLPQLAIEAHLAQLPGSERGRPIALTSRHQIQAANSAARQLGIEPGQKKRIALALAPELHLFSPNPQRDQDALQAVIHLALSYTPQVCIHQAQAQRMGTATILMQVQGSLRYRGGRERSADKLEKQLRSELTALGYEHRISKASTALAAAWLASAQHNEDSEPPSAQGALAQLPVELMDTAQAYLHELHDMGLHTLGALRAMPREGITQRFGESLLEELDRAWGDSPQAHEWLHVPSAFVDSVEFTFKVDSCATIMHAAEQLLRRLLHWARAQQQQVRAFELRLQHESHKRSLAPSSTCIELRPSRPSNDLNHLLLLLRERVERCMLPAASIRIELRCHELTGAVQHDASLFPSAKQHDEDTALLVDRLRARLGDEQVYWLRCNADHRPDAETRPVAGRHTDEKPHHKRPRSRTQSPEVQALRRPLWLLPQPLALEDRAAGPHLNGKLLRLLTGPERLETGWWDGELTTRDYFIAQDSDSSLVWIYRERLQPNTDAEPPNERHAWHLQGRFG